MSSQPAGRGTEPHSLPRKYHVKGLIAGNAAESSITFLIHYLQPTLDYTFVPRSGGLIVDGSLSMIALMASFCPKPLVASWMLAASGGRPGWPESAWAW